MANSREAAVRLVLDNGQYITGIRQAGDVTEREQKRATKSAQMWGAGISKVGESFKSLGGQILRVAGMAATLGGAFSFAGAIHSVVGLETSYKNLAFQLRAGKGEIVSFRALMADGNAIAARWGRSNDEVAKTVRALYDDVGDIEFAKAGANEIAKTATATGASVEALSTIAGQLNEKFGITAKQIPNAMAAVVASASKGGIGLEDVGEKIGLVGASAKLAGMDGVEGFQRMMGMLNLADAATGNLGKTIKSVTGLFDKMVDPVTIERAKKELKLDLVDKGGSLKKDALQQLLTKTGGKREELAKVFQGDQLKLLVDFGKTYAKAFEETGGDIKTKTAAALAAFDAAVQEAGKQTLTAADLDAEAKRRLEDPQRRLQEALNTLQNAMGRPEIVDAINKLAQHLPALANAVAKVIGFIAERPGSAAAGIGGAMVGKAFLGGMLEKAAGSFAEKAFGGTLPTSAGGRFAAAAFGPAVIAAAAFGIAQAIGNAVQDSIEAKHAEKRKGDAQKLQAEIDAAQNMSEDEAVKQFGERGRRFKRGELSNEERLQLAVQDAKSDSDAAEIGRGMSGKFSREAEVKAMGFSAPSDAGLSTLGRLKLEQAGLTGASGLKAIERTGGLPAAPEGGFAPAASGAPKSVSIDNHKDLASALASSLRGSTLRVELVNPPGSQSGRGAPVLPPARAGGG